MVGGDAERSDGIRFLVPPKPIGDHMVGLAEFPDGSQRAFLYLVSESGVPFEQFLTVEETRSLSRRLTEGADRHEQGQEVTIRVPAAETTVVHDDINVPPSE